MTKVLAQTFAQTYAPKPKLDDMSQDDRKTEEFLGKLEELLTEYGGTDWEYKFEIEEDGLLFSMLWIGDTFFAQEHHPE